MNSAGWPSRQLTPSGHRSSEAPGQSVTPLPNACTRTPTVAFILFIWGLVIYLVTRLWAIERFPIYFFTDEATFSLLAEQLLSRGLRDSHGSFLPLYFEVAGDRWTPVLAVYAQLPAMALFGKSIIATRVTSALFTLSVPIASALALRLVFRIRNWWLGALLIATVPTWFLHSRTAFEWLMMASFYACFLMSYLLYLTRSPRFLFMAICFGAATFYNHASGQLVMIALAVLLSVSDLRYHLKNWRTVLPGLLLVTLLAVPLVRFQVQQPRAMLAHLRAVGSYWVRDTPLVDKLRQFASTYAHGLSPGYWFFPNDHDLVRHRMKGYGNMGLAMLPFVLTGTLLCLRRIRSGAHRAVLLAAVAAPAGAATAEVAITRMMAFVPPICIIAGLGLDLFLEWFRRMLQSSCARPGALGRGGYIAHLGPAVATCAVLSGGSLWMLRDALTQGPTWFTDYGLYGMQYGARQLFVEAIPQYLATHPDTTMTVSPNWANGADNFVRFFLPPEQQFSRVQMHDVRYFMVERRKLSPNIEFVLTPEEYEYAKASGKFRSIDIDHTVPYPDGRIGFYFARLAYAQNLEEILSNEREERSRPVIEHIVLDGQKVKVLHSQFDIGLLPDVFDGDPSTLVRGLEANPLLFELTFPHPRRIGGLKATFGSMDFSLKTSLYADSVAEPVLYEQTYRGLPLDPTVEVLFNRGPASVTRLRIEVLHLDAAGEVHIHVRELKFSTEIPEGPQSGHYPH